MFDERAQAQQQQGFRSRLRFFSAAVTVAFFLLVLRFYFLQIVKGSYYKELSENNRLALVKKEAPRGLIYDRNRRLLASNRPSFKVSLTLEDVKDLDGTSKMLVSALELDPAVLEKAIRRVGRYRRYEPVVVREDVPRDRLAYLEALKYQYPGVEVGVESRREYPEGELASHVLGYVGEISPAELNERRGAVYNVGDYIGKTGLEREYDGVLKGIDGGFQVEVDSLGRRLRVLNSQEPLPGYNLVLTLDRDIQRVAEEGLGDAMGAVVVMDPRSGEILAAVSRPPYDPNLFAMGISSRDWKALLEDERHPIQNRTIQSQYPPGSVFKLVMAVAGLQEGAVTRDTAFFCGGGLQFGNRFFRCWKKDGHGYVGLHRAIVESCDTYFYRLGERLGIDTIARYARELGLGCRTGVDLPGEWPGLVPDSNWKRRARGEKWYPGETLSVSIGQGYNLLTPLQMAVMISALANGGDVFRPLLVKEIVAPDGREMESFETDRVRRASIRPEVLDEVRKGMWGVVNEPGGTGVRAHMSSVEVAGKTGTSQVVKLRDSQPAELPENLRDHAWFGCYAPYGAPEVVIVVMKEHGGHGGSAAGPVAQAILKLMFESGEEQQQAGPPPETLLVNPEEEEGD